MTLKGVTQTQSLASLLQALGINVTTAGFELKESVQPSADFLWWLETRATSKAGGTVGATRDLKSQVTCPANQLWLVWSTGVVAVAAFTASGGDFQSYTLDVGGNLIPDQPQNSSPPGIPPAGELLCGNTYPRPRMLRAGESVGYEYTGVTDATGTWLVQARLTIIPLLAPLPPIQS